MSIKYHHNLIQGSSEWFAARCGLLTASEMENIITPKTLQPVKKKNPDEHIDHLWELLGQRITGYVEPAYVSDHMLRGQADEVDAKYEYEKKYARITDCGFVTNDKWGFTLGCSPDGLVNDDPLNGMGGVECKGRLQKFQVETILNNKMPDDYRIQVQTTLLITERQWWDFNSYCGGMPMLTVRVYPDAAVQKAIVEAATIFHQNLELMLTKYHRIAGDSARRLVPTVRRPPDMEMHL